MKKRLLAWILAVCVTLSLFPVIALAETTAPVITIDENSRITVDGVSYLLVLGEKNTENGTTTFSSKDFFRFIENSNDTTSFESDILLLDETNKNEAPEAVYTAFWNSCNITITKSELSSATVSEIRTRDDGYHKYISCSVDGEISGSLFISATQDNNSNRMVWRHNVSVCKATKLVLDQNGQASFDITEANPNTIYAFYVDLGADKVAEVSARLTNENVYGKVTLENGKFLWRYFEGDTTSKEYSYTVSSQKIMFLVHPFSFTNETTSNISGTVNIEIEQPYLLCRHMSYNRDTNTWYENASHPLQAANSLQLSKGESAKMRLYYGTSSAHQPLIDLSSENPSVASISEKTAEDGNKYFIITCHDFGTATLTCGNHQFNLTVGLPYYGFYSSQIRDTTYYLSAADTSKLSDNALWFMSKDGFTEADIASGTYTVICDDGCDIPFTWKKRGTSEVYDMKIDLTNPVNSITIKRDGSNFLFITVSSPQVMIRHMSYNRDTNTWYENASHSLQTASSLQLSKGEVAKMRLYYGTSSAHQPLIDLSSENPSVASISEKTAEDGNKYFIITCHDFGTATLTCGNHQFNLTVGLPYYGFYSSEQSSTETYLNKVTLTGTETDLTEVWFVGKNAFVDETITVMAGDIDITKTNVSIVDARTLKITLPSDMTSFYYLSILRDSSRLFSISVTSPSSDDGNQSGNEMWQGDYAAYIDDYVVGFALKESGGEVTVIRENCDLIFGHGTFDYGTDDIIYQMQAVINIAAATKGLDSKGATTYTVNPDITNSIAIKKLRIEPISGDNTTFSWSENALVTELTSVQGQSAQLYVKEGRNCRATICAEITVTVGEKSYEKTVRANIGLTLIEGGTLIRPDDDTTEQLNAFLIELAKTLNITDQMNELYHIELGNTTYEGTIEVPSAFVRPNACLHFDGASGNGEKTVVNGSLDVNGANIERIKNIHFIADESSMNKTKAIFGGGLRDVLNCSFYGYDIALDSSEGLINARKSVFINNEIAAMIKIDNSMNPANLLPGDWNNNTFINNGIAVQIMSLCKQVSPYYFRIYDSNFINNEIDIDARCGGTLYMYRNYFGQYRPDKDSHRPHPGKHHPDRHNGRDQLRLDDLFLSRTETKIDEILEYSRPKINTKNGTKIIMNPRWLYPVKDWWCHNMLINDIFFGIVPHVNDIVTLNAETEYKDILVADWDNETIILNEESSRLIFDASAFTDNFKKEIDVVDDKEAVLGTWIFD